MIKRALSSVGLLSFARVARDSMRVATPRVLARELRFRVAGAPDGEPLPPPGLIHEVIGHGFGSVYWDTGRAVVNDMARMLRQVGAEPGKMSRILDWGCGSGRLIRQWREHSAAELFGSDYNARLIEWCDRKLRFASFGTNELMPPLRYADATFDLVYARSVFTHLGEETQQEWFAEIRRVLADGGYFLNTTHGDQFVSRLSPENRRRYQQGELVIENPSDEGSNRYGTFQSQRYIETHVPDGFELVGFFPGRAPFEQDTAIFRRLPR